MCEIAHHAALSLSLEASYQRTWTARVVGRAGGLREQCLKLSIILCTHLVQRDTEMCTRRLYCVPIRHCFYI